MNRLFALLPLLLGLVAITGCDPAVTPIEPSTRLGGRDAAVYAPGIVNTASLDRRDVDQQAAALVEKIAGFAGVYLDGDAVVVRSSNGLYNSSPEGGEAMLDALRDLQAPEHSLIAKVQHLIETRAAHVLPATYAFDKLYRWKSEIARAHDSLDGLQGYGIDHQANAVAVDVHSLADTTVLREGLNSLSIPVGAIAFRLRPEVKRLSYDLASSEIDPTVGGISVDVENNAPCTLGFNVLASYNGADHRAFLTADHCTVGAFGDVGDIFYQPFDPNGSPSRALGVEKYASAITADTADCSPCYSGDVALVEYYSGQQYRRGTIPMGVSWGSSLWSGDYLNEVVSVDTSPVQGQAAEKVGVTTGHTYGTISNACYNWKDNQWDVYVKCTIAVTKSASISESIALGGDSGSPVFWDAYANKVSALGVLFAGTEDTPVSTFYATGMSAAMTGEGMSSIDSFNFIYNGLIE